MRKFQVQTMLLIALTFGVISFSKAQNTPSEPIFGSVLIKKTSSDSTKKKSSFNIFKPAFLRVGIMGGATIDFNENNNAGALSALRIEYGFSNKLSLVTEIQGSRGNNTAFANAQVALGVNWMPFKSRRLQPFFGLGAAVGHDRGNGRYFSRDYYNKNNRYDNDFRGDGQIAAFARTGVNYVLCKKIIATAEALYQYSFKENINGGVALKMGVSYQLSKKNTVPKP
jgi:hypothetical protein